MHIGICDDIIADRKQLERLLERESDRRIKTTGNLYIDSFGSIDALLHAPMKYDLFFIDYHSEGKNGDDVAIMLRNAGVTAPIVMCSGDIDYTAFLHPNENMLYLNKPILVKELSDTISKSLDLSAVSDKAIPIQGEADTVYVLEPSIMYVNEAKHILYIHCSNDIKTLLGQVKDLAVTLENNAHFYRISKECIINLLAIEEIKKGKLRFTNGETLPIPFLKERKLKLFYEYAKKH